MHERTMNQTILGLTRLAGPFVYLVALHSFFIGAGMAVAPKWVLGFGGFSDTPAFFVRQGGVFHVVLAAVYFLEWQRRQRLGAMLVAKWTASVFLVASVLSGEASAWAVKVSLVGDIAMAIVATLMARGLADPRGSRVR